MPLVISNKTNDKTLKSLLFFTRKTKSKLSVCSFVYFLDAVLIKFVFYCKLFVLHKKTYIYIEKWIRLMHSKNLKSDYKWNEEKLF